MNIFPYRVRFTKTGRMRFLSHHDLLRLFERALRRTGLPLRMTEGYNPHPILSFPTALGLGIESLDEVMEFELSSWVAPRAIQAQLAAQLPEGMGVTSVETFSRQARSFVDFVEYEASAPGQGRGLEGRIRDFLARREVRVERKSDKSSKEVEIRQYVLALEHEGETLFLRIRITDAGTARPEEVLRALGLEPDPRMRIRKTYTEVGTR